MSIARPTSVVVALQIIASLSASVSAMRVETLERRASQTNAVCDPSYAWADTTDHTSPCQSAANVLAPCNGGSWLVPALINSTVSYANPGANPSNPPTACACSWAAYNLLSACSDCQGLPQAVKIWPDYKSQCPGDLLGNTTYYPPNYLPSDVTIPYWAATNPMDWQANQYNAAQAKALSQEGHADLGGDASVAPTRKKSSVGPIVGGVVGALVVLGLAAGVAYHLRRKYQLKTKNAVVDLTEKPGHQRNQSDQTMISQTSLGYSGYSSPSPGFPTNNAPTIRTHVTSNTFSAFGSPPQNASSMYTTSPSPPPRVQAPSGNPEDFVLPFTLQHQRNDSTMSGDSKRSPGRVPLYDSPNAPPNRAEDTLLGPETPERPRLNPPAYSPHDNTSPSSSASRPERSRQHTANGSDADHSFVSVNSSGVVRQHYDNSGSSVFTTPMEVGESLVRSGSAAQTTYTEPVASPTYPRDVKRRRDDTNLG